MSAAEYRKFGEKLAFHSAPTLLGIKCANLISLSLDEFEIGFHSELFNRKAVSKGLKSRILCCCGTKALQLSSCTFGNCRCHRFSVACTAPVNYCCFHSYIPPKLFSEPDRYQRPRLIYCTEIFCTFHNFQKYARLSHGRRERLHRKQGR